MTNFPVRAVLLLVCLVIVGCHPSAPSLVGTYSVEDHGKLVESVRLEHPSDKFILTEKKGQTWETPTELKPATQADLDRLLKGAELKDVVGLGNQNVVLLSVPKGWKAGPFESKTGYLLLTILGPIELHKGGE